MSIFFGVAGSFLLAGCGDDCCTITGGVLPTPTVPIEAIVGVTLREFTVTLDTDTADSGRVTFVVTNAGEEEHEFLVVKTDLAPDALPTEEDGSYQEDGPGTQLIAEIEEFEPSDIEHVLSLDLEPGHYVLLCNLVEIEDGEVEAHYALGMFAAFTVE